MASLVRLMSPSTFSSAASTLRTSDSSSWNHGVLATSVIESSSLRMVWDMPSTSDSQRWMSTSPWSYVRASSNAFFSSCASLKAFCRSRTFEIADSSITMPRFLASATTSSRSSPRLNMSWKFICLNSVSLFNSSGVMIGLLSSPAARASLIALSSLLNSLSVVVVLMRRLAVCASMPSWSFAKSAPALRDFLFHAS